MSESPQKILVRQWISRAENDLLNVRNNLAAQEIPWDTICFHSQQAAEKHRYSRSYGMTRTSSRSWKTSSTGATIIPGPWRRAG